MSKMNFVVNDNWWTLKFDNFSHFQNVIINNLKQVLLWRIAYENQNVTHSLHSNIADAKHLFSFSFYFL